MMNLRPVVLEPGDKCFLTPDGYKFFYAHGLAKTHSDAMHLLARHTIEKLDIGRGLLKLHGIDKWCQVHHIIKQVVPGPTDYPTITVVPDLTYKGGNVSDLMGKNIKVTEQAIVVGRMPMGTKGGGSTVFIIMEDPDTGKSMMAETTMKLFLQTADQLRKFDNPAGN
jgi:hypothetical protein